MAKSNKFSEVCNREKKVLHLDLSSISFAMQERVKPNNAYIDQTPVEKITLGTFFVYFCLWADDLSFAIQISGSISVLYQEEPPKRQIFNPVNPVWAPLWSLNGDSRKYSLAKSQMSGLKWAIMDSEPPLYKNLDLKMIQSRVTVMLEC